MQLTEREEVAIRERQRRAREEEYTALVHEAQRVASRGRPAAPRARLRRQRRIDALERGLHRVESRDHFHASGRESAARVIAKARGR
jgi:hypothetical protein